ncbi:hypothetical protein [Nocardia sp. NPDC055049]
MTTPDPHNPQPALHDCTEDPGPIHSYFAAMAFLMTAEKCRAEHCLTRARAEQALARSSGSGRSPRMCESRLEEVFAQRIYDRTTVEAVWQASSAHSSCRIDPGLVNRDQARVLVRLHHRCDETRCRPKLRGLQAMAPVRYRCPPPQCGVPDPAIAAAVADYRATKSVLKAVKEAFYAHQPGAEHAVISAIAEYAAARRRRDALFLRALPADGSVPTIVITKFRLDRIEINRLIPVLDAPLPPVA